MTECVECRIETLEGGLAAHLGAWQSLLSRTYDNRVFLTPTFLAVWSKHFGDAETHLMATRDGDDVLAILPLQTADAGGKRVVTLLGNPEVMDYMDALAERDRAPGLLSKLWERSLEDIAWDCIELRHVPSASPLIPALQGALAGRGIKLEVENDNVCPVAVLCSDWDGYLQTLSKKQRHEIRRKLRRAQEGVEWEWRTSQNEADLARDLPIFFRLHEASARDKARFMTPRMRAFFEDLSAAFLAKGMLRLSVFRREGVDIAATMSFLYRDRYLLYNSGYDPAYAAHSPGIAAAAHAIQDAISEKAAVFDFLSGDESYKYQLGATNTYTSSARAASS